MSTSPPIRSPPSILQGSKKLELWKTSAELVVHLKRFAARGREQAKLRSLVKFPIDGLDLWPYVLGHQVSSWLRCMVGRAQANLPSVRGFPSGRRAPCRCFSSRRLPVWCMMME